MFAKVWHTQNAQQDWQQQKWMCSKHSYWCDADGKWQQETVEGALYTYSQGVVHKEEFREGVSP